MIKMRETSTMKDQAHAAAEHVEAHKRHVIANSQLMAPQDRALLEGVSAEYMRDFATLSQLFDLTLNDNSAALAHQLVSKLILNSWVVGVSSTLSPEADQWRGAVKGWQMRQARTETPEELALSEAVEAERKPDSRASAGKEAVAILDAVNRRLSNAGFAIVKKEKVRRRLEKLRS